MDEAVIFRFFLLAVMPTRANVLKRLFI